MVNAMASEARRLAPELAWPHIASRYAAWVKSCSTIEHHCRRTDDRQSALRHLVRLTDRFGTFEHAEHATPRREHGYCVDDVARVLVVSAREPQPNASVRSLAQGSLAFVGDAMGHTATVESSVGRRYVDERKLNRGLLGTKSLGLGTAAASAQFSIAGPGLSLFERGANSALSTRAPWPSPRSVPRPCSGSIRRTGRSFASERYR